ncbi:uncharacterized protein CC84DRAFT_1248322 [Paraphaeosphaeria sporulosa]|uniref:Uncharacterized protein n=1 Tax=Paraphaeosphaeria sporulosa TaxID=1460663 RepID=A0A177C6K2_9PLEO|nr:uncharacterized protein CC84DRAFT_1248322 [Paraphaeosphaeria sporulosa]OAG03384.1 hypothetical protein CC84DRAFT_1248322 [Paraphaeosphaeria sporulosa]
MFIEIVRSSNIVPPPPKPHYSFKNFPLLSGSREVALYPSLGTGSHSHKIQYGPSSSTPAGPAQNVSCFIEYIGVNGKLPQEIREAIWEMAMRGGKYKADARVHWYFGATINRHLKDPVQRRRFYDARIERPNFYSPTLLPHQADIPRDVRCIIRCSKVMVASFPANQYLRAWLATVPHGGLRHVRHLQFDFFGYFPTNIPVNSDLALAGACQGLKTIRMSFRAQDLTHFSRVDYVARGTDELLNRYKLERLLNCNDLNKIFWHLRYDQVEAALQALQALGSWFRTEFAKQKQSVVCVYL